MKDHDLLLFYIVPWLALGTKMTVYLDKIGFGATGLLVMGTAALYVAAAGSLAFKWGRRKQLWLLLLGCLMQYGMNRAAGGLLLGEELWRMETFAGILYLLAGFWQAVLYFCGRKESLKV